jgi:hypothetical protein
MAMAVKIKMLMKIKMLRKMKKKESSPKINSIYLFL